MPVWHEANFYLWHEASMLGLMSDTRPSKDLDKIIVRLPDGMRDQLAALAKENKRSVNAEVVSRLERSIKTPGIETIIHVLLDTNGAPTSWHEIHEHVQAISRAGRLNVAAMEVRVITPQMISSTERDREATALAKKYRALNRAANAATKSSKAGEQS